MMKIVASLVWFLSMSLFASQTQGFIDYYIAPSSAYLDWSTPKTTLNSYISSALNNGLLNPSKNRYRTGLGHSWVHFDCMLPNGEKASAWSGISGESNPKYSYSLMAKDGIGLNILRYGFRDGFIQNEEVVKGGIATYLGRKDVDNEGNIVRLRPMFMRFEISPSQCLEVKRFYSAFNSRTKKQTPTYEDVASYNDSELLYYALNIDSYESYMQNGPEGKLGGGCTSYSTSVLKVAGVYPKSLDYFFQREVQASPTLFGNEKNKVSLQSILLGKKGDSWIKEDHEKTESILFYDPEKIFQFMHSVYTCTTKGTTIDICPLLVQDWLVQNNLKVEILKNEVEGKYHGNKMKNVIDGFKFIKL
ncbi:MAG: hypothetical protein ACOYL6_15305 [Bacteriovoracaceae bacterium]